MAENKIKRAKFGSLQPDVEDVIAWSELTAADFAPATSAEKDSFIQDRPSTSYWKDAWRRFRKNKVAMVALVVLVLVALFAFVGPMVVPYSYDQFISGAENLHPWHYTLEDQQRVAEELAARTGAAAADPETAVEQAIAEAEAKGETLSSVDIARIRASAKVAAESGSEGEATEAAVRKDLGIRAHIGGYSNAELQRKAAGENVFPHLFGTDRYGRDIMVRVMIGTRVSMLVGLCAALLVLIIGALYGSISGYFGGKVDAVMQRIVEVIYSVPEVLVILLLSTVLGDALLEYANTHTGFIANMIPVLGKNLISMFLAFGLLYWVTMSRIIRGQILQLKQQEYVTAARALGASGARIIRKHLLPNCIGQIVVTTCLQIPSAIFLESFLSFLGVGVTTPMTSLGSMASEALEGLWSYPYRLLFPAIILSVMILAFNLVGDGLRDALDPKLKK
ncbi:MAG TPA: ABC transporter permease [Candidatus Intestinimonas stercoravium]|mgnify:FL=1|uniref:ABC transporter permease n=1 Tax=uncultured Intestinimonas sp. TaxID=1689265 RepID=UPI001F9E83B6|nr:ABC transporter permease [uncultured Intestinimonas sp.]HJA64195.1 ABC transporter permease [Candidatus Intestinimonas stercoravium]